MASDTERSMVFGLVSRRVPGVSHRAYDTALADLARDRDDLDDLSERQLAEAITNELTSATV